MRGHTKFLAQGERTEIAAVKVRIAHGFARFHACAHRVFDAPQRARQGKNYLNTRVLQRVRVASSASSGRMTASSMEIFSGTCAQSLKNARSLGRPPSPCVRVSERNIFKRYGGLFAALFAELFQYFTA